MGWLWLAVIGMTAFGALAWVGRSRTLALSVGAALAVGAAGYAWQQHATLPGHPVRADAEAIDVDPGLAAFRTAIMPGQAGDAEVLAAADERLRAGDSEAAAQGVLGAIGRRPNDPALWAGLGSAIAAHDGQQLSPAAKFAFARAMALGPSEPGPPFLLGLTLLESGELPAAKAAWLRALALAPRDAPYRVDIAERLVLMDQLGAMRAGAAKP